MAFAPSTSIQVTQETAPPDLHHVAQAVHRKSARPPDQVGRAPNIACVRQRDGAVFGWAFVVAGDHEAVRFQLTEISRGGDQPSRDRALHVDRATRPAEQIMPRTWARRALAQPSPGRTTSTCSKGENGGCPLFVADCKQVLSTGRRALLPVMKRWNRKTQRFPAAPQGNQNTRPRRGGHALGASDQRLGKIESNGLGRWLQQRTMGGHARAIQAGARDHAKLDLDAIPQTDATGYPPQYAEVVQGRRYRPSAWWLAGVTGGARWHLVCPAPLARGR